jgi:hypothetical protein
MSSTVKRWHWPQESTLVVPSPGTGPGHWAGAPSAYATDDAVHLAYRVRKPVEEGRGHGNVIARSTDGLTFETVAVLHKDDFGAESLERPAIVQTDDGTWRLYVSCATPGTKHWRVDVVESRRPEDLSSAPPRTVLPGDETYGVKDPVLLRHQGAWHLWAAVHPLDDPDATDRMTTQRAVSADGVDFTWQGTALAGRPSEWDSRGARVTAVIAGTPMLAFYDGRASAEENWEERTGLAVGVKGRFGDFTAHDVEPVGSSPFGGHGLRYVSVIEWAGQLRAYYEVATADGSHELRTCRLPALA